MYFTNLSLLSSRDAVLLINTTAYAMKTCMRSRLHYPKSDDVVTTTNNQTRSSAFVDLAAQSRHVRLRQRSCVFTQSTLLMARAISNTQLHRRRVPYTATPQHVALLLVTTPNAVWFTLMLDHRMTVSIGNGFLSLRARIR